MTDVEPEASVRSHNLLARGTENAEKNKCHDAKFVFVGGTRDFQNDNLPSGADI